MPQCKEWVKKQPTLTDGLLLFLLNLYTAVAQQSLKAAVIGFFHFGAEHTGSKPTLFAMVGNAFAAFAVAGAVAGAGASGAVFGDVANFSHGDTSCFFKIVSYLRKFVSLFHGKSIYRNNTSFGEGLLLYSGASQDGIHLSAASAQGV
jgi:hypothetical protein